MIVVRIKALDTIGKTKPSHAIELIAPFLSDDQIRFRVAAAFNLGRIGYNQAVHYLIKAASEDSSIVMKERLELFATNKS